MTAPAGEGFPKAARVRRRREYLALARTARRRHTPHFILLCEARSGESRLGVTVSRKIGDAVVRNRVKRRVREVFRRDPRRLLPSHDVVVIAKAGAGALALREIAEEPARPSARAPSDRGPDVLAPRRVVRELAVAPLRVYRVTLSPLLPRSCRFEPTCSEYAVQAVLRHGVGRGAWLAARRLFRCRPACAGGLDPVPAEASS